MRRTRIDEYEGLRPTRHDLCRPYRLLHPWTHSVLLLIHMNHNPMNPHACRAWSTVHESVKQLQAAGWKTDVTLVREIDPETQELHPQNFTAVIKVSQQQPPDAQTKR